jgi:hypothetical protein
MITQLHDQEKEKNLGMISILVLNISLGITCIFAPSIVQKVKSRWIMLISSFGYTAFLASGIVASSDMSSTGKKSFVLIGSMLCGIGAAIIWVTLFK